MEMVLLSYGIAALFENAQSQSQYSIDVLRPLFGRLASVNANFGLYLLDGLITKGDYDEFLQALSASNISRTNPQYDTMMSVLLSVAIAEDRPNFVKFLRDQGTKVDILGMLPLLAVSPHTAGYLKYLYPEELQELQDELYRTGNIRLGDQVKMLTRVR